MAIEIKNLQELKKIPFYSLVYFKRDILDLNEDFYDIGYLIEDELPERYKEKMQIELLEAIQKTYHSPAMQKIRQLARLCEHKYNWDIEPFWDQNLTENTPPKLSGKIPKGRDLIVSRAPVPKHDLLIKEFVSELEKNLDGYH